MKNVQVKLAAAITTFLLGSPAMANDFSTVSQNIVDSSSKLPNLISTVAYVGGVGLGVAGVFKLKQHVDNPGQTPMKDGLARLGAGGGLLALPFITQAMTETIGTGGTKASPAALQFSAAKFN